MKIILFVVLLFTANICSKKAEQEKPLARVGDKYLYGSDIKGLLKNNVTRKDSSIIIAGLIEKWIRKQLILEKAELNLLEEEKNVQKELEDYRTSLIIYKYEQKYINEKLDTVVNEDEIKTYYELNSSNFTLSYDLVKAIYIKIPTKTNGIEKIKLWLKKSEEEDNISNLESFCFQHAIKYEYFNEAWVNFNDIQNELPKNNTLNYSQLLKTQTLIEATDSLNTYYVAIKDIKNKGTIAPLSIVKRNINSIILLKRRQTLINELENKIYFDALSLDNFVIYKNN